MNGHRERLANRRAAETFGFECDGMAFAATVGRFGDGRVAEVFLRADKADSALDTMAKDSAVLCSIALQFGVPLDVIRRALLRDPRGVASSPLGAALDRLETQHGGRRHDGGRAVSRQEDNAAESAAASELT